MYISTLLKDNYFEKFNCYRSTNLGKNIRICTFLFSYFYLVIIVEIRTKKNKKNVSYQIFSSNFEICLYSVKRYQSIRWTVPRTDAGIDRCHVDPPDIPAS